MRAACTKSSVLVAALLSSCSDTPARPADVPEGAVYSGGPEGGFWLICDQGDQTYNCQVFNAAGGLYQSGSFSFLARLPDCYPGFVLSDYRCADGFLSPALVHFERGSLILAGVDGAADIEEQISARYDEELGIRPDVVEVSLSNPCGDGDFTAYFSEPNRSFEGKIWARSIVQLGEPAQD